jgi:hypothetical protein
LYLLNLRESRIQPSIDTFIRKEKGKIVSGLYGRPYSAKLSIQQVGMNTGESVNII